MKIIKFFKFLLLNLFKKIGIQLFLSEDAKSYSLLNVKNGLHLLFRMLIYSYNSLIPYSLLVLVHRICSVHIFLQFS